MGKMRELRSKMEALSLQKKDPKKSAPRVLSAKKSLLPVRKGTPRPSNKAKPQEQRAEVKARNSQNFLQLPPLSSRNSPLRFRLAPLNDDIGYNSVEETSTRNSSENSSYKTRSNFKASNNYVQINNPSVMSPGSINNTSIPSTFSGICNENSSDGCSTQKHYYNRRHLPSIEKQKSETKISEKQTLNQLILSRAKSSNVLDASKIAIVEEEGDPSAVNVSSEFSPPSNAIPVPSKEATTFTLSQVPRERVTSVGSGRYRISRIILDEGSRPKTSPEKLSQHEKSTLEMWGILTDSKWHRHRRRSSHCHPSVDVLGFPSTTRDTDIHSHSVNNKINEETSVSFRTSLLDFPSSSQRFHRNCVNENLDNILQKNTSELLQPVKAEESLLKPLYSSSQITTSDGKSLLKLPTIETKLPHLVVKEPKPHKKTTRVRCTVCKKKLNITNTYSCHCQKKFCSAHRYSELHDCTYDYKAEGRRLLEQSNPLVTAPKLPKI